MGQWMVVDSNMIQSPALDLFLQQDRGNRAVVAIEVFFELYKQRSLDALRRGLDIFGRHPGQVVGLRSTGEIIKIEPQAPDFANLRLLPDAGRSIAEMMHALEPTRMNGHIHQQLKAQWDRAAQENEGMLEGAADILASLPEMQEQMFSKSEIGIIRRRALYTPDMFGSIFGAAEQLSDTFSDGLGVRRATDGPEKASTLTFRIALGLVVYLLWWISTGSQSRKKLEATRNDVLDLLLAAQATYFDGFLSEDTKARWIHTQLAGALEMYGETRLV
jgi:hypothetical protein